LGLSILAKFLIGKKISKNSNQQESALELNHDHSHLIYNLNDVNPKSKILGLMLLMSHRIPGGLIIGFLISNIQHNGEVSAVDIVFLVTFILHIIPEELILYYRQMEMGVKK
jgi:zinc transporter ZupT